MPTEQRRRAQERTRLGGNVRLLVDTPDGLRTTTGQVIDLSEGGCAIRLPRSVRSDHPGRVLVEIARSSIWLPVITRWVRADPHGWIVGCEFDRPTDDKMQSIRS